MKSDTRDKIDRLLTDIEEIRNTAQDLKADLLGQSAGSPEADDALRKMAWVIPTAAQFAFEAAERLNKFVLYRPNPEDFF